MSLRAFFICLLVIRSHNSKFSIQEDYEQIQYKDISKAPYSTIFYVEPMYDVYGDLNEEFQIEALLSLESKNIKLANNEQESQVE
jgi:hypothetical protein